MYTIARLDHKRVSNNGFPVDKIGLFPINYINYANGVFGAKNIALAMKDGE